MKDKRNKIPNFPNLRFEGFQGEWEEKTLGEICELTSSKRIYLSEYVDNGIPFYRGKEISELKQNMQPKDILYISSELYNEYKNKYGIPQINDILITAVGTLGNILVIKNNEPFYFKDGNLIWLKNINVDSIFLAYLLEVNNKKLELSAIGSSQKALTMVELRKLTFLLPLNFEQKKIATFLSLLDDRISTQIQVIEELETLMKTTVKNFHNTVEKTEYKIADLGNPFRVMNLSKEDLSAEGEKCILYGELFTTYGCVIDEVVSCTEKSASQKTLSGENDLLFPASTTVDSLSLIAPSAISIKNVILGGDMFGIRLLEKFNNEYISYLINYVYKKEFAKYAQGSTIVHLYHSDIKNVKILLPNLKLQIFLADLMRLLNNKIQNEQRLLSEYQNQKKYLLSQMFI